MFTIISDKEFIFDGSPEETNISVQISAENLRWIYVVVKITHTPKSRPHQPMAN
ncbi:MAG: hypothetical protein IPH04_18870 [Saprospirales bacterium]|nr:hypothetical protein [Saprospirales bacterium]